jgi:hypothetical protein
MVPQGAWATGSILPEAQARWSTPESHGSSWEPELRELVWFGGKSHVKNKFLRFGSIAAVALSAAVAAPIMHVHDSGGVLARVDVATGNVNVIGNMGVVMTDIAFDPSGDLFGLSFTGFYSINAATGAATLIGNHSIPGGNALVFSDTGTLYAAGANSTSLFTINPATGASTNLGSTGFASGGDLAFNGGDFFLASSASSLVRVDLGNLANSAAVGPFGVPSVFGLATGNDGVLYGVAGTQIFSVNTATGAATNPQSYAGQGLGTAFGQSFRTEAGAPDIPEPATYALVAAGSGLLLLTRRRRKTG